MSSVKQIVAVIWVASNILQRNTMGRSWDCLPSWARNWTPIWWYNSSNSCGKMLNKCAFYGSPSAFPKAIWSEHQENHLSKLCDLFPAFSLLGGFSPLWKKWWLRQLGSWHSDWKSIKHVPNHQPGHIMGILWVYSGIIDDHRFAGDSSIVYKIFLKFWFFC